MGPALVWATLTTYMAESLYDGLIWYCCLVIVIALHEFGHAWSASACGDQTARSLGRVTINPIAHMDMLGTVILPLAMIVLSAMNSGLGGFIIGWGKPVPVVHSNLKNPRLDSLLVALAGPFMNLVLAAVTVLMWKLLYSFGSAMIAEGVQMLVGVSLFLMFLNLLPIPPLDGSYILKYITNMRDETYHAIAQYGFLILIVAIQMPIIRIFLRNSTDGTMDFLMSIFQIPMR